MRILSIEDDQATAQAIELMLTAEGFKVQLTGEGEEGVSLGKLYDYDCILLDIGLPDISGMNVIRQLRDSKIQTPIICVTGRGGRDDLVRALNAGADDFMVKPFHKDELTARIRAVVRRCKGFATSTVEIGDLIVHLDSRTVTVQGALVHLTGKEYQMLELMALRKGMTLSKEAIMNHLYGGRDEPELKIIDVFVCKLRKKLRACNSDFLETVWGRGYVLRDPGLLHVVSPSIVPTQVPTKPFGVNARKFVESPPLAPIT